VVSRLGVASSGSWSGQLASSYESSNEPPVSTECEEFVTFFSGETVLHHATSSLVGTKIEKLYDTVL